MTIKDIVNGAKFIGGLGVGASTGYYFANYTSLGTAAGWILGAVTGIASTIPIGAITYGIILCCGMGAAAAVVLPALHAISKTEGPQRNRAHEQSSNSVEPDPRRARATTPLRATKHSAMSNEATPFVEGQLEMGQESTTRFSPR